MDIIGIVCGFIIIIVLNAKKIDMGLSLFAGAITAGIFSHIQPPAIYNIFISTLVEPMTVRLTIIVTVISGLGYLMKENGDLDRMIATLHSALSSYRLLSMIIPALIGTLSVPGGAILSAPMIEKSSNKIKLTSVRKTAINLFYRHIFFPIYPLYASLILTGELFQQSKIKLVSYNLPIVITGVIVSYIIFFNSDHKKIDNNEQPEKSDKKNLSLLFSFLPIISILILGLVFGVPFHIAVFAGLLIAMMRNLRSDKSDDGVIYFTDKIKKFLYEGINYKLIGLIIGIMYFKSIVEATGAVNNLADFLSSSGIPLILMIIILGLLVGGMTGINLAAMGILIPIFIPLLPEGNPLPYISLLFVSSFTGYLISPLHLCLVLTREYFAVGLIEVYKYLLIPFASMILIGVLQVIIL